jgi:sugar phosphate permease
MSARLRRWRWVVYSIPACIYFVSYIHRIAPAVVAADLMRAFAITASTLGTLAAIYPYMFAAMALVAGALVDTLGPRRTLTSGCVTMAIGAVMFGVAPVFPVAFIGRLLVGVGGSVILVAWLSLLAEWFPPAAFATASGATQGIGNFGALVASMPLALTVEALGWRETFVLIGVVTGGLAVVAALLIRDTPEAVGLPRINAGGARTTASLEELWRGVVAVTANRRTWPPVLATTGIYATKIAFLGLWGVPYLTQVYGFDRVQAANRVSLIAIGLIVGAPLIGWLSDRWLRRRRLPFGGFALVYAACWIPFAIPHLAPPAALLGPLLFLMGLSASGLVLVWACVREVNDPARIGMAMGFVNMPIFLGLAVLQWGLGVILDVGWTGALSGGVRVYPASAYATAFAVCLVFAIGALVAAALVTETHCRNVWRGPAAS